MKTVLNNIFSLQIKLQFIILITLIIASVIKKVMINDGSDLNQKNFLDKSIPSVDQI